MPNKTEGPEQQSYSQTQADQGSFILCGSFNIRPHGCLRKERDSIYWLLNVREVGNKQQRGICLGAK